MSEVWNHFKKNANNTTVVCNNCNKNYKWKCTSGTTTLTKHLLTHNITIDQSLSNPAIDKKNTNITPEKILLINQKYINFIIKNSQPFILSENLYFIQFVKELNQLNLSLPIDHHELYRALSSKYQIRKR